MENSMKWTGVSMGMIALALLGVVFLRPHQAGAPTVATSTSSTATTSTLGGVSAKATGSYTVKETPTTSGAPSLSYKATFSPSLSPEVVAQLSANIVSLQKQLRTSPSEDAWLSLALQYKIAGDYKAAASVWTYLTTIYPTEYVAYANLGDLNQNFLHIYPAAEANYLVAILLKPSYIDGYRNLFMLYRYQYKTNTTAAADIVAKGLAANPGNPDLLQMQQQLQTK